jgi:hypothetical protein
MENIFMIAFMISFMYFVFKFIEMRFIEKESLPLKVLVRDVLIVYISALAGFFINTQVQPMMRGGNVTPVFTDNPGF